MKKMIKASYDFEYFDSIADLSRQESPIMEEDLLDDIAVSIANVMDQSGVTLAEAAQSAKNYYSDQVDWVVDQLKKDYNLSNNSTL